MPTTEPPDTTYINTSRTVFTTLRNRAQSFDGSMRRLMTPEEKERFARSVERQLDLAIARVNGAADSEDWRAQVQRAWTDVNAAMRVWQSIIDALQTPSRMATAPFTAAENEARDQATSLMTTVAPIAARAAASWGMGIGVVVIAALGGFWLYKQM